MRLYICSLSELFPDSDPEADTLNFGVGRGPCDRENDRRGDIDLTALLSIMSKSSLTCVFNKSNNML